MKILVTGSNGLLGQKLITTLIRDAHQLGGVDLQTSTVLSSPSYDYSSLDLTSRKETHSHIRSFEPQVIIHCAAMTAVDACESEREKCWQANVFATENICSAVSVIGARVIYISTDYVFDGERGPYSEEDVPNPQSYYAKSKLAGENVVRGSGSNWTIIRTIVLYGYGFGIKSSFVTWLLGELRAGRQVRIVDDQWGNSTLSDDLAEAINRLLFLEKSGLYHMGGNGYMTRFEMAIRIARFFKLDESLISPISTKELKQPARRPLRSGLITEKAENELYYKFRDLEQSLKIYREFEQVSSLG